ncbi:MAG: hypothetical protein RR891_06230 [Clostridium sp.]
MKSDKILGEDFHKMLLGIQNLIECLNRNYSNDEILEEEVNTMTKTLYDPEVERRAKIEVAKNLLDILDDETISAKTDISVKEVAKMRENNNDKDII